MAGEAETSEHITKYKKLKKKARQMLDTTALEHRAAYIKASEEHLKDEETGLIDYEKLETESIQSKFAKTMADHYISKAKQALNVGKEELDDMEKALLMNAYAGVTEEQIKFVIKNLGKKFTFEEYEKRHPKYMENIQGALYGAAGQHLEDKHISDLLKEAKATELVNADYVTLEQAKGIHDLYEETGAMSRKLLEDSIRSGIIKLPKTALKKKEEEKKAAA